MKITLKEITIEADATIQEVIEEIVRCRDCKWRDEPGCAIRIVDESDKPKDNDYCSFGERRSDES